MPKRNRTSAHQIKMRKRRAQAAALREQGVSYYNIAQQLGCSASTAYDLAKKGIEELQPIEDLKIIRQLKLTRLDELCRSYYARARKGDDDAATQVFLRLDAEHSKLAGAYPEPGAAALNVDASVHNRIINIVGVAPAVQYDTAVPPIPRLTQQDHYDEVSRGAFPHRLDATPSAASEPPSVEPVSSGGGEVVVNGAIIRDRGRFRRQW
jgi:Homeodomain-like domain